MLVRPSLLSLTRFLVISACLALGVARCGSERPVDVTGAGGTGGSGTGGAISSGGTIATGGRATGGISTGGTSPGSGGRATGGISTGGTSPGSGGRATGGISTGGTSPGSGGRVMSTGGTSTGSGGRSGGSGGGPVATGGAPGTTGGASGGAGPSGGAGGSSCGVCPPTMCKPGYAAAPSPSSCCLVCLPIDCSTVDCAPVNCPAGMHGETVVGQCCSVCMPGSVSSSCQSQRDDYTRFRESLISKYRATTCATDADCVLVTEANRCRQGCPIAFPRALVASAEGNLSQSSLCSACPAPDPIPPCAPTVPLCSNGQCTEGSPR